MVPNLIQSAEYRLRRNQGGLSYNIWIGVEGGTNQVKFYSAFKENYLITEINYNQYLLQIYFSLDVQVDKYQRTVFSFLDLFEYFGVILNIQNG